jgi:hypothetical protein
MRRLLIAVIFCSLSLLGSVASAGAASPWWHVATMSSPASPATGEAMVTVDVANVGDAATPGTSSKNLAEALAGETKHLVTVTDTLPAGVRPIEAHAPGGGTDFAKQEFELEKTLGRNACSILNQTVTCVYMNPLSPYEQILVAIVVKVEPGVGDGLNEASVSGAGAPPVTVSHALALEGPVSFGVQSYELTAEEEGGSPARQAGEHPFQLTTTLMLATHTAIIANEGGSKKKFPEVVPVALVKDLRFSLPAGLVGNPTLLPKCNQHVFLEEFSGHGKCPNDTVVGVAAPMITALTNPYAPDPELHPLYSLEPSVGEPAKFAFLTIEGPVILDTSVRTGGDYGVVVTAANIPSAAPFIGNVVTFWGVPADARHDNSRNVECIEDHVAQESGGPEPSCPAETAQQPFLISPTSCTGPLQTSVQTDSWGAIGQFTEPFSYSFQNSAGEEYGQVGCNRLNFEPSIKVAPDGQEAATPTGLTVDVHVAQEASLNPSGLTESNVKDTTVTLPAGVALNPAGADGLQACGLLTGKEKAQEEMEEKGEIEGVNLETAQPANCPEAAKVGTLEIKTPLLPNPLVGAAYLATQNANPFGSLLALYIVAKDRESGVLVKLAGEVKPDPVTGQLTSTFKETPQLPFEDLKLHFFGGSRAPLGTPALCGGYTTTASIAPWSGNPPVQASSEFQITSGPNGSPCASPLPFSPSLTTGSLNLQAGAFTPFTTTMSRVDGEQALQGIQLHFPPGLSGLLSGVALCGEAQANEGTCGPGSLIGETTVSVGLGGNPFSVKGGRVYITGPYQGAPFGLSIVNPAKAGPFDLEKSTACDCVVVRAKIEVDPHTAALTITTDNTGPYKIPTILQGIPLQIQHVNVVITRPGFTFNPTNCNPMAVTGSLLSTEGASSALSIPFQVTNCATLKFAPKFQVSTSGKTSRAKGASLSVKLTYPKAPFGSQANIARVKVDLPKQLPSRLTTLQKACTAAQFESNPAGCPTASLIGHATAVTPLIPVPLVGPAYFVSHGGEAFPSLIVVLQGYGVTLDLVGSTFISKAGITSSTFKTVPDAPVGSFELTLPEGKYSALAANGNLCKSKLAMPTAFTAQNGLVIHASTKISVTGCPKAKKAKKAKHKAKGKGKGQKKAKK